MNIQKACDILELSPSFSLKELKHNYHLQALKYHPDKNKGNNTQDKFIEINEAYQFLTVYLEVQHETTGINGTTGTNDYLSFMENFLNSTNQNISKETISQFIQLFSQKTYDISIIMFKELNKDTAIKIYKYLVQYKDIFKLENNILQEMEKNIRERVKDDNIIILNPTIDNLLDEDIYKLDFQNDIYYIPLWHNEISYDISNSPSPSLSSSSSQEHKHSTLLVKCIPSLPDYISLDQHNNIHINIKSSIQTLFSKDILEIQCGGKVFELSVAKLNIKKKQIYIIYNKGISLINTQEIFDVSRKSHVYIHIEVH